MSQTTVTSIETQCKLAKQASHRIGLIPTESKNKLLNSMADALESNAATILSMNQQDVQDGANNGMSESLQDRLMLNDARIKGCANALRKIATLPDPVGRILDTWTTENGLTIKKVAVPLGVFGMIYEARPNVTVDAIGLALKTGNAVVLRGSSSAYRTNKAIVECFKSAMTDIPTDGIQLLEDTTREGVQTFVQMSNYLDLVIPRGGAGLIQSVVKTATVPTIETGVGNCHIFVDSSADLEKAVSIVMNAKIQRPSVCNSCESLLVHADIAKDFLPKLGALLADAKVEVRGCSQTLQILDGVRGVDSELKAVSATDEDWGTEFLDFIISIKIVNSVDEAIAHIRDYGTTHSEAILSNDQASIDAFTKQVDASSVLVNTSTRFTDGEMFGFGAEIGISTQKLHARGPMGLPELCSYKYVVEGNGQIRE